MIKPHSYETALVATFLLLSGPLLTACGGDSDDDSCSARAACGGNVVGTWEIKSSCAAGRIETPMDEMCKEATVDARDLRMTGTMTFKADNTYTTNAVVNGTMKTVLPTSCLQGGGQSITCAQLDAFMKGLTALTGSDELVSSCKGSSECECTFTFKNAKVDEDGTYSIAGTKITQTSSDDEDEPETFDYCADRSTLTLSQTITNGSGGSSLVLSKK